MEQTGFAAWVSTEPEARFGELRSEAVEDGTLVRGRGICLYTRSRPTTTHAIKYGQCLVDDRGAVVSSGSVHNRREVEDALGLEAADGDPVLLRAAWDRWDCSAVEHVRGEFGFLVIDTETRVVVSGTDTLGIHKLFLAAEPRGTWLTSDLALLFEVAPHLRAPGRKGIASFLGCGAAPGLFGDTLYDGITQCPGGAIVVVSDRGVVTHAPPQQIPPGAQITDEEAAEELRRLVSASVDCSLASASPVCMDLSGGLDSSTVASVAARSAAARGVPAPVAFSLFSECLRQADERDYQRSVVEYHGLQQLSLNIDDKSDLPDFRRQGQPGMLSLQGWAGDCQRDAVARMNFGTCLTGQGGDAIFAYFLPPLDIAELWQAGSKSQWLRSAWGWSRQGRLGFFTLLAAGRRGDVLRLMGGPEPVSPSWINRGFAPALESAQRRARFGGSDRFCFDHREFHHRAVRNLAAALPPPSAFSWEPRFPLLSTALVDFAISLPWRLKVSPNQNRILQRMAFRGIVPQKVLDRRSKAEFGGRLSLGLSRSRREWDRHFDGTHLADLGLVESKTFRGACDSFRDRSHGDLSYLAPALLLEAWLAHCESAPAAQSVLPARFKSAWSH